MEPIRLTFWNVPKWAEILQYVGGGAALLAFAFGVRLRVKSWRQGKPEPLVPAIGERLRALLRYGLLQWRLSDAPSALAIHWAIFAGMGVLLLGTAAATVDWDVTRLLFGFQFLKGFLYQLFELALDLFGLALLAGLAFAAWRRYVQRPPRLRDAPAPTFPVDSFALLAVLAAIAVTGYLVEAFRLAAQKPAWAAWSPAGYALSALFRPASEGTLRALHFGFWCLHALLSFALIALLPWSKAFHMLSSALSVAMRKLTPPGALVVADPAGVEKAADFTRRQLLQLDGCAWCGRCQDACPAHASGLPLSPRNLVLRLAGHRRHPAAAPSLHGPVVSDAELWACTTCQACESVCPVFIDQPRMIVDLRRHKVGKGEVEEGLQDALMKLGRYGNSFGQSDRMRARWTQGLETKVKDARKEPVDCLWLVGDYASYDPRVQDVTRTVARIFQKAGLDFGILYEGERNAGNDARRIGEEGLFEVLRDHNLKSLEKARYQRLATTDPHSYNTLKNEYPLAGKDVLHYTELLDALIREGRLPLKKRLDLEATYHDPCYLGRYNGITEAPRRVLAALGVRLREMPRNRSRSWCCGAGGGRIWLGDVPGIKERPAENRVREAAALGVGTFAVACPKDIAMFRDAVKTAGLEGKVAVKDVAELVWEAMDGARKEEAK